MKKREQEDISALWSGLDLSKMQFPPDDLPHAGMYQKTYSAFKSREIFVKIPIISFKEECSVWNGNKFADRQKVLDDWDMHRLILFSLFMCQRHSPFSTERDVKQKVKLSMKASGIELGDLAYDLIMSNHPYSNKIMKATFQILNDKDFEAYVSLRSHYHMSTEYLRQNINYADPEKSLLAKDKIRASIGKMVAELDEIEQRIFVDTYVASAINDGMGDDEYGGWAEEFAVM